jgi:hypothetical protein
VSRRAAAGAAVGLLLALNLLVQPWNELPRRVRFVFRFAPRELAVRRLSGSGTAFDRRYFSFLENARRRLPASAAGVAIYGTPGTEPYRYLATYTLAPVPVRVSPETLPEGWVAAIYGPRRPPGARILEEWEDGALAVPSR